MFYFIQNFVGKKDTITDVCRTGRSTYDRKEHGIKMKTEIVLY